MFPNRGKPVEGTFGYHPSLEHIEHTLKSYCINLDGEFGHYNGVVAQYPVHISGSGTENSDYYVAPINNKGLITSLQPKYEDIFFYNIDKMRNELGCSCPIEVWTCGKELSIQTIAKLQTLKDVYIMNTEDFEEGRAEHWRGWQIKGIMYKYTRFDEALLYDADNIFYQKPCVIFDDEGYKKTGTYFFKDLVWLWNLDTENDIDAGEHPRYDDKFKSVSYYKRRREWIRKELPHGAIDEWNYLYEDDLPTTQNEAVQESSVVLINKKRHWDVIDLLYRMNDNHTENFKYAHGDKELWWIAFRKLEKEFTFNEKRPEQTAGPSKGFGTFWTEGTNRTFYKQYYGGNLYYSQKEL